MLEVNVLAVTGIFGVRVMEHLGQFGGDGISDVNVFLVMGLFGVRVMGVRDQLQGWMGCWGATSQWLQGLFLMQGNGALGIKCRGEGYQSSLKAMGSWESGLWPLLEGSGV